MNIKAVWNGVTIAESDETVVIEGNHYFPSESLRTAYLLPSEKKSTCFWKGKASYYDLIVDGQRNPAVAWFYPEPSQAATQLKGHIAFWKDVEIVVE
jgi:uncharacterized protein (DUF427 family)